MARRKTAANTQFGLASSDGTRATAGFATLPDGYGGPPLVDEQGRLWVVLASGVVVPAVISDLEKIAGVIPLMSGAGRLGVNAAVNDVEPLLGAGGRVVVIVQDSAGDELAIVGGRVSVDDVASLQDLELIAGVAPSMSGGGRLATNVGSNDVPLLLGAGGRAVTIVQDSAGDELAIETATGRITAYNAGPPATLVDSFVGASSASTVAAARRVYRVSGYGAVPGSFVQLHDSAATPAGGAVPKASALIPPNTTGQAFLFDFAALNGLALTNGLSVVASSTVDTYTAAVAPLSYLRVYST